MIEKILSNLQAEADFFGGEPMGSLQKMFYCKGVEKAISIVQEVAKDGGWIPVETELPKVGVPVLVCNEEGRVFVRQINWISRGKTKIPYWSQYSSGIIAWQPLPAPYQKGE